jgi:predicted metalloprotease
MRWRRRSRSPYLRDERAGGGGPGLPVGRVGLPLGILGLVAFFVMQALGGGGGGFDLPGLDLPQAPPGAAGEPIPPEADPDADLVEFVNFVLQDVQTTWDAQFRSAGRTYRPAELVLFSSATRSGCGSATSEVGPFYCPADATVYVDLDFFRDLRNRFGAPGDFAQAYVIAHEFGHHVQNLLGINEDVARLQQQQPEDANELSIRLELQADCLAGVWGYTTEQRGILEQGDVREGLDAAAAVGDDRIQREATGRTNPETWTHGSSEQRTEWFSNGFQTGDPDRCDTFSGDA